MVNPWFNGIPHSLESLNYNTRAIAEELKRANMTPEERRRYDQCKEAQRDVSLSFFIAFLATFCVAYGLHTIGVI